MSAVISSAFSGLTLDQITATLAPLGLEIYGSLQATPLSAEVPAPAAAPDGADNTTGTEQGTRQGTSPDAKPGTNPGANPRGAWGTLLLLGTGPAFWAHFKTSPEYHDSAADPLDRWSKRVIDELATTWQAEAYYPFTGPPYQPFVAWALASGRCFTSPSQMMVHDRYGMMISLRGALRFARPITPHPAAPPLQEAPCLTCANQPCLTRCPVDALRDGGPYDVAACRAHLSTPAGAPCLDGGCLARRACPLSAGAARSAAQSAHHMRYFLTP
ncbi:ferredoxin [Phaeobacter sp.]|uniref:ferredoxin n=1 Tax=Phaeobacter sp. TaxID=1902409 RepID=UPI0025EA28C8|nr:ferredoxin [Phaeobacter sp.]